MAMTAPRQMTYGLRVTTDLSYEEAIERMRGALKEQGFGVLTEIDVKRTLKEKKDIDFRRYVILGACNPGFAARALSAEIDIGLLLPCNVVVYETDDGTVVETIDPIVTLGRVQNKALEPLGAEVKAALTKALEALPAQKAASYELARQNADAGRHVRRRHFACGSARVPRWALGMRCDRMPTERQRAVPVSPPVGGDSDAAAAHAAAIR